MPDAPDDPELTRLIDDAHWQPWTPRVGQRVRVRRSAECPARHHIADPTLDDGRRGTVYTWPFPGHPQHPYYVRFDVPSNTGVARPPLIHGSFYAASELEPLDAAR